MRPITTDTIPAVSDAKKPAEKTAPTIARRTRPPTPTISPSSSAAPTRDHHPASRCASSPSRGVPSDSAKPPKGAGGGGLAAAAAA
jgi:hypothetical protein